MKYIIGTFWSFRDTINIRKFVKHQQAITAYYEFEKVKPFYSIPQNTLATLTNKKVLV